MPYYVHAKNEEPDILGSSFLSRESALQAFDPREQKITFVASDDERRSWQNRERDRFSDGLYVEVPWNGYHTRITYRDHFAHMSIKQPGLIAYTKNDENGVRDIQTSVRPGKYLQEFYKEIYTSDQIAEFIAQCSADNLTLKIATTPDDIETVYINGPRSCMAHSGNSSRDCIVCNREPSSTHYTYRSDVHPVRVYGDSDLAVAYYGPIDHPSARCVVWPDKKIHGRIYGSELVMGRLLEDNGYTSGSFDGAKIRVIENDNGSYVMPYIDCYNQIGLKRINGKEYFVLGEYGYECDNTNGCTEVDDDRSTCDHCNERYDDDDYGGDGMCQSCYDDTHAMCTDCDDSFSTDDLQTLENGDSLCRRCARDAAENCVICSDSFIARDFAYSDRRDRELRGVEDLCADCADTHEYCSECSEHYEKADETIAVPSEVIFPTTEHVEAKRIGIYPSTLQIATSDRFDTVCTECNRGITCPDTMDLLSARNMDRTDAFEIGLQNLIACADLRRAEIAAENSAPIILPIYRKTRGGLDYMRYEYKPQPYAVYKFPFVGYVSFTPRLEEYRLHVDSLKWVPAIDQGIYSDGERIAS